MLQYKIVKKAKNIEETVIECSNITNEFTIADVNYNITQLEKAKRELEPVIKLQEAKISNIVEHNPSVLKLTDTERMAAHLYNESSIFIKEANKKIKEIDKQLKKQKADLAEIKKQTGLEI